MDKYKIHIPVFMLAICLISCGDFLDRDPFDEISKADALDDIESLELAVNGTYDILSFADYYGEYMTLYADVTGGNLKIGNKSPSSDSEEYLPMYDFVQSADIFLNFYNIYVETYLGLLNANNIIGAVPKLADGSSKKRQDQVLGQALALRALFHFDLLRLYAQPYNFTSDASHKGIVLQESSPFLEDQKARSSVAESYELVEKDLERAIELLSNFNDDAFFSKQSAQALLARLYLYQGEWSKATTLATSVIDSKVIELANRAEYLSIWSNDPKSVEHLFRMELAQFQSSSPQVSAVVGVGANIPSLSATQDLLTLFEPNDIRLRNFVQNLDSNFLSTKYPFRSSTPNDISIIRLSEVYLTRAEAFAKLGRNELAQKDLNLIRQRANPTAPNIILTGEELVDEILLERRRELALEGHLLFDLNRSKKGVSRTDCNESISNCNQNYPNDKFILPIPQKARDSNKKLEQNDGY